MLICDRHSTKPNKHAFMPGMGSLSVSLDLSLPVSAARPLIAFAVCNPLPPTGYTGNYAGHVGATLAFMVGLFDSPSASNYKASNVWDVIPSDVVANVILASAAALAQGLGPRCHVSPTRIHPLRQGGDLGITQPGFASQVQHGANPAQPRSQAEQEKYGSAGPLLIVHCGSSTTYPLTIMESWNWGVEVYGAW